MINQNSQSKQPQSPSNEELLIQAARQHKLSVVNELIEKGANVNYVLKTNCDSWYSGDTHTPLYLAVHSNFQDQQQYLKVIQALLKAGANPNFKARRGGWNHSTQYPLFSGVPQMLKKFKRQDSKLRFIENFVKHGVQINQIERNSRSKNWRGYQKLTCFIFEMMDACGIVSRVNMLRNMCEINMVQQRRSKQQRMRQKFLQQNPNVIFSEQPYIKPIIMQNRNFVTYNTQLIETLINLGADANSYKSEYFWENNQDEDLFSDLTTNEQAKQKRQMRIFTQTKTKQYESILHRAIMNNLPKLVKLLIEKGAKVDKCCEVTISKPIYPNEWPKALIKNKLRNNAQILRQNQQQKQVIEEKIRKDLTLSEEERKKLQTRLNNIRFSLYKAKRFCIENEFPEMVNETITVSCEEIAIKFGVDESIIQMLGAAKRQQLWIIEIAMIPDSIYFIVTFINNCEQNV